MYLRYSQLGLHPKTCLSEQKLSLGRLKPNLYVIIPSCCRCFCSQLYRLLLSYIAIDTGRSLCKHNLLLSAKNRTLEIKLMPVFACFL